MMQPEFLQPSWPLYNIDTNLHQLGLFGENEFSPSNTTTEDSSGLSCSSYFPPTFSDEFIEFPFLGDEMIEITFPSENIEDICTWLEESEAPQLFNKGDAIICGKPPIEKLPLYASLDLPGEDMEIDNQLSLRHLLEAYGEATEMGQRELGEVIVGCINERASQLGESLERIAFRLFQSTENRGDYLKEESSKNFELAFKAFYEISPYGRFAHFAANTAILEAIPGNAEMIHIVDFDIGEGVQWAPVIEAIGKQHKALKLTSIKLDYDLATSKWRFDETKRRLYDHARSFGVMLKIEEMGIEELRRRESKREWLAFNCMVGFPHMGKMRKRRNHVVEFLRIAKELQLSNSAENKGVIIFADGEDGETERTCPGFASFFNWKLEHYKSLCESIEWSFPTYLTEARMAVETLFVGPYVSCPSWYQQWEEGKEGSIFQAGVGLEGWRLSTESLMEAREMVKDGESSYKVRIEGEKGNEMVLEWRGTPLVRVSTWFIGKGGNRGQHSFSFPVSTKKLDI